MPARALYRDFYVLYNYRLTRRKRPFLASYKLTYRCNLSCQQCPFRGKAGSDPAYSQAVETVDRLYARGSRILIFEGGEPTLWKDGVYTVKDLALYAQNRFFSVGMTTNGTSPLDSPVDVLWVSLDGLGETHDRLRGGQVFDRVIVNIRESRHPKIYAHITVNNLNFREVPQLIRFLRGLVKGVTIQFYYPYHGRDELFLSFEERSRLLDQIITLKRDGYPVMNSFPALVALKRNTWRCVDWLVDNAEPDGSLTQGCYLKNRGEIDCARCGFSPHTEVSLAYQGNWRAAQAGLRIFFPGKAL